MKKYPFILLLLATSFCILEAQSPEKNEKKVYRSEDNKLYINKNKGVYLWISTSPDPDGEKIRLVSDSSQKYSNPLYFDTEGYNTVRSPSAVDTNTKKTVYPIRDIIFEVYADGLPPSSKAVYKYSHTKTKDGKKYYSGPLSISLTSKDKVSGIQHLFYSLNSNTSSEYAATLSGAKEGENILKYYSIDKVGNKEDLNEEIFYLDNSSPKSDYKIVGDKNEKYVSANASIELSSVDNLSGVKAIFYKINNGKYIWYSKPIPAKALVNDQATISFYAEDNLGNKEKVKTIGSKEGIQVEGNDSPKDISFEFYVDREAPDVKIEIEVVGDLYKGKYSYVSPRTKFKITAADSKAGVEKINYSINSSLLSNNYQEAFLLDKVGLQYVHASASDYVGNVSAPIVKPFFNDAESPLTSMKISSPKFTSRDTLFVSSKTSFTLTASDAHSGVSSISYSIDGSEKQVYEKAFSISGSGLKTIRYAAIDKVGNTEKEKAQVVFVDNDSPKIHYQFSVESIGKKVVRDEDYTIYPSNAMVYIAATDSRSGGEKIEYSINSGTILSANPIKSLSPGNYLVEVFAYDVLGNQSKEVIKFAIEE